MKSILQKLYKSMEAPHQWGASPQQAQRVTPHAPWWTSSHSRAGMVADIRGLALIFIDLAQAKAADTLRLLGRLSQSTTDPALRLPQLASCTAKYNSASRNLAQAAGPSGRAMTSKLGQARPRQRTRPRTAPMSLKCRRETLCWR
ncbi:hypothetical protein CRG98_016942 [Punica granatum]|uniref:Pectinesterase inhibitor domain-containing protein n=1 Tax=Punica granatum TaxID=22663 RepID=A0A2I0K292_PUNGR|nr:hypothetical protein CRG98_016942 [Punica granatum]